MKFLRLILLALLIIIVNYDIMRSSDFIYISSDNFPLISARIFLTESSSDVFNLYENNIQIPFSSSNCLNDSLIEQSDIILMTDISMSMQSQRIEYVKNAIKNFSDVAFYNNNRIALAGFNEYNYLFTDFTNSKTDIATALDYITPFGSTSYLAGLSQSPASINHIAQRAENDCIAILISDGYGKDMDNISQVELSPNIRHLFIVILSGKAHPALEDIKTTAEIHYYEDINTEKQLNSSLLDILAKINAVKYCDFSWSAIDNCSSLRNVKIESEHNFIAETYTVKESQLSNYIFNNDVLGFKSDNMQSVINRTTIYTNNKSISINSFILDRSEFEILSPISNDLPIIIPANDSLEIEIQFSPNDIEDFIIGKLTIESSACFGDTLHLVAGNTHNGTYNPQLSLDSPQAYSIFSTCDSIEIAWSGVFPDEPIEIFFSSDNGNNWHIISDSAVGLKYLWKPQENISSSECLISISAKNRQDIGETWLWSKSIGGGGSDFINSISVSPSGESYVLGAFSDDISFEDGSTFTANSRQNLFISKHSASGELNWAQQLSSQGLLYPVSINYIDDNSIYFGLNYEKSILFQSYENSTSASRSACIIKISSNNNYNSSITFENTGDLSLIKVKEKNDGSLLILLRLFSGRVELAGKEYISTSQAVYIIAQISSDFEILYSESIYSDSDLVISDIAMDSDNNLYMLGLAQNDIMYGNQNYELNIRSVFIFHFNLVNFTSILEIFEYSGNIRLVSLDLIDDRIIITGNINGNLNIYNQIIANNYGKYDGFILSINPHTDNRNSLIIGGTENDFIEATKVLDNGVLTLAGTFQSEMINPKLESQGLNDIFTMQINKHNQIMWEISAGEQYDDIPHSVSIDGFGNSYIAGKYWLNTKIGNREHISKGVYDGFITKINNKLKGLSDISKDVFSILLPEISTIPIDFGNISLNYTKDTTVSAFIQNVSTFPIIITSIVSEHQEIEILSNTFPVSLQPQEYIDVTLRFIPSEIGEFDGKLIIYGECFQSSADVFANVLPQCLFMSNNSIDFDIALVGTANKRSITLKNNCSYDINLIAEQSLNHPFFQYDLSDITILANEEIHLFGEYIPDEAGFHFDYLVYRNVQENNHSVVRFWGVAVIPNISIDEYSAKAGEKFDLILTSDSLSIKGISNYNTYCILKFESTILTLENKNRIIGLDFDTTTVFIPIEPLENNILANISFIAGLGKVESSIINISEFGIIESNGISESNTTYALPFISQDGFFRLDGICYEGGTRLVISAYTFNLQLIPNPTSAQIELLFNYPLDSYASISIIDIAGNNIFDSIYPISKGENSIFLPIDSFPSGTYFLIFKTEKIFRTMKFIIQ